MNPAIRSARVSDAEAVGRVYTEASVAAVGSAANREAIAVAAAGAHPMWRPLRRPAPGQWMLVHDASDGFAFTSFGRAREKVAHLYALYVAPSAWGVGIGSSLHDAALQIMRADGVVTGELWVQVENERARRFYVSRGWESSGDERANDRGTFIRMEKPL